MLMWIRKRLGVRAAVLQKGRESATLIKRDLASF